MADQGIFITLEGVDGSGKGTQFKLLAERLKAVGYDVELFDFPRYDQPSSHFVRRYLNGDYGPAGEVSPYSASMFYALDRYEAAPGIRRALEAGKIVLANRYVGSNMAHQGAKFASEAEQRGFFIWADSLEYQLLALPRPNLNIFLRVPAEVSFKLIGQKNQRQYTDKKYDEHEADIGHLTSTAAAYDSLCQLLPKDFVAIECTSNDQLMSIPAISDQIWQTVRPILPEKPQNKPVGGVVKFEVGAAAVTPVKIQGSKLTVMQFIDLAKSGKQESKDYPLDWADPKSNYSFYTPPQLDQQTREQYLKTMQSLVDMQKKMRAKAAKHADKSVEAFLSLTIPLASYVSVELSKENLALAQNLKPITTAKNELSGLVRDKLPTGLSTDLEPLMLLESLPRNEFEILSDGLYGFSDLPRREVQAAIDEWSYDQKYEALTKVLKNVDAGSASQIRYRFDVIASQKLLLDLLTSGLVQNLQLQAPTVRYGYDVPEALAKADLEDDFISCFDMSLELFSTLQSPKYEALAANAVLTGHKVRFQFSTDLASLIAASNQPSAHIESFKKSLIDKIGEVHPLIASFLSRKTPTQPKASAKPKSRHRRHRSK